MLNFQAPVSLIPPSPLRRRPRHMCKSRKDNAVTNPIPKSQLRAPKSSSSGNNTTPITSSSFDTAAAADTSYNPSSSKPSSSSTSSSVVSLSSLKDYLPDNPTLYPFSEICSATNNFLSRRLSTSSSSSCWRCTLRGKDTVVFQRKFQGDPARLRRGLASICKIHHSSIVKLLGASLAGDYIYLVYDYVHGASLADCLRNPRNPRYTPLATWGSRMLVAKDIADGLAYIHYYATGGNAPSRPSSNRRNHGPVHNQIKSSSVIVTEPQLRAKICHVGASVLSGETTDEELAAAEKENPNTDEISEISEASPQVPSKVNRSNSSGMKIQGTRAYMAPEILSGGSVSQKSDVYAFGVVLLELLSGEEPLKYKLDQETKDYMSVSLIGSALSVMGSEEEGEVDEEERHRRIRRWVDGRLRDSFPVAVAVKMLRLALDCVELEAARRPDMERVAGKVSKMTLESEKWAEKSKVPTEFTVSMAPR